MTYGYSVEATMADECIRVVKAVCRSVVRQVGDSGGISGYPCDDSSRGCARGSYIICKSEFGMPDAGCRW